MSYQKTQPETGVSKAGRSLRTTLFLETLVLLAITVVLTGIAAFFLARHELTQRTVATLESAVSAREQIFETKIAREKAQLSILAKDPSLARLPSITNLVGFRQLLRIDNEGIMESIAGHQEKSMIDSSILTMLEEETSANFQPIVDRYGWNAYVITAPQTDASGKRNGMLVAVFDPSELVDRVFETGHLNASTEVLLATMQDGTPVMLHSNGQGKAVPIQTNDAQQQSLIARAFDIRQGTEYIVDYSGIPVLSAYRTMPSVGWTIIVQMDTYEMTAPILRLAMNVTGIGLLLICLLSLSMFALARRITQPLIELSRKLNVLETRRWHFNRSIFTGNELETVDAAADDLARRLRESYDHLEDLVQSRTEDMRKEHARNKAILENIEYGVLMTDAEGIVVFANRAAELLTKKSPGELLGKTVVDAIPIMDKESLLLNRETHPIASVLKTKKSFAPAIDPQLSLKHVEAYTTPLFVRATPVLRGMQCIGSVAVLRDTTDERRIDRVKSEFIALVSHQLRTPLSSMRWYIEMLLEESETMLTKEQRDNVAEISLSNTRMVHLVNALLNVSRLELGTMKIADDTVLLPNLLQDISKSFKLELEHKKMTIATGRPLDPSLAIKTDRGLLQLILENLVSNGIKYGKEGTAVLIDVENDARKASTVISVTTTGIGIPEGEQREIFTKMFRGTNAKASDTDGSGLGLYISHVAAQTIGATLDFTSTENEGTTFRVNIPVK